MVHDALGAHSRDELGISDMTAARPVQAALASAAAFSVGAAPPLLIVLAAPTGFEVATVSVASLMFLVVLGAVGAKARGANMLKAALRVTFWGALAMAVTAGIGMIFGANV
jgi:vacuolar iron transporter family protein